MNAQPVVLTHFTATTCAGHGTAALLASLQTMHSHLAPCQFDTVDFATCTGTVNALEAVRLPAALQRFDCRNNRLAALGLQADGFAELKFFPAVQAGGLAMLKAWQGPFGDVRFCPTGGISPANAAEFLALKNVVCVGGSWLVPTDTLERGDWSHISALAREAAALPRKG